ncbi:hypothetical protein [Luteimonas fraxinea]|uniref:hypothetical protein n=1 Tax=Luteimonas fraxinea TaxID=2901869 RepID=UPI001E4FEAFF|nr:hypothetical protein [Luteimonas fraxinea]MCD9125853.1 hypothetical protein [Luteimonas fraxinea]
MRDGIGFGGVFLAMLCALLAHDALRLIFAALGLSVVLSSLPAIMDRSRASQPVASPAAYQPRAQQLERWQGPIQARQQGISRTCINGRLADRNANGWSDVQPQTACIATSE